MLNCVRRLVWAGPRSYGLTKRLCMEDGLGCSGDNSGNRSKGDNEGSRSGGHESVRSREAKSEETKESLSN